MNKSSLTGLLALSLLLSAPVNPVFSASGSWQIAANVSELSDIPADHWAYHAIKVLVEELDIMPAKSATEFKGQDLLTRYELAEIFYRAMLKLESISGKNLSRGGEVEAVTMTDLDEAHTEAVNAIVNTYGIMQPMPGKRFMGSEPISRYEIAFEMFNYFTLLESKGTSPSLSRRDRVSQLEDLPADHWATKAVTEIIDKYQIMNGYPDQTFRGGKRLSRYEAAATIREFIRYVDTYLIPLSPTPTPLPTPEPTPEPTPVPTPVPTPSKVPVKKLDLRVGGDLRWSGAPTAADAKASGMLYGPQLMLDWTPLSAGDYNHFGLDLHGDFMLYEAGRFKTSILDQTGVSIPADLNSRLSAGGGLLWKLQGSAEEIGLTIGAGYDYLQLLGAGYSYATHGPRGRIDLEIPVGPWFSLVGRNTFTWFLGQNTSVNDNFQWKNDAFLGITLPAYSLFAIEAGYRDTRYMKTGNTTVFGDTGAALNLRFRF